MNMSETMKHVLIVGGIREAHDALLNHNCEITWFVKAGTLIPGDQNRRCHQIFVFNGDASDDDLAEIALTMHQVKPFDFVCSFHDNAQTIASVIARKLGIQFPYSDEVIDNTTNKFKMRRALSKASLNTVKHTKIDTKEDIEHFLQMNPDINNFILKPINGTGSLGVTRISRLDTASIESIINENSHSFPMLMEEFIEGKEFSVESFTHNGRHHVAAVTEKFKKPNTFMESGHLVPARLTEDEKNNVCFSVSNYLTALDVKCGPTHTEVMVNDSGVYIIETHTRVGGDQIPTLVKLSTGIDLYNLAALQAIGKDVEPSKLDAAQNQTYACIKFLVQDGNNEIITAIEGIPDIEQQPNVKNVYVRYKVSDKLVPVKHSFDRAASVLAVGDTAENALATADQALVNIRIKTAQGV